MPLEGEKILRNVYSVEIFIGIASYNKSIPRICWDAFLEDSLVYVWQSSTSR